MLLKMQLTETRCNLQAVHRPEFLRSSLLHLRQPPVRLAAQDRVSPLLRDGVEAINRAQERAGDCRVDPETGNIHFFREILTNDQARVQNCISNIAFIGLAVLRTLQLIWQTRIRIMSFDKEIDRIEKSVRRDKH